MDVASAAAVKRLALVAALAASCTHAIAADYSPTDRDLTSIFSNCAAVAFRGKQIIVSGRGQQLFGGLYTQYLTSALALAPLGVVRGRFQSAIDRLDMVARGESQSAEDQTKQIIEVLKDCSNQQAVNASKFGANASAEHEDVGGKSDLKAAGTTTFDVLNALGKPAREDYDPDGRFVYLYETTTGYVAYLFDSDAVLIRFRGYCDSKKSACSQ
jgi:hypothetical protein